MPDTKISALTAAAALSGTDPFPVVQGGVTVKSTPAAMVNFAKAGTLVPLTLTAGTVTSDTPFIAATQTWNAGAVTFNGMTVDVTDTASAAASNLLNLKVGGSTKFRVDKAGVAHAYGGLVLPKTTGYGIKVDNAAPTFGWRDILGDITVRGTGANDPTFATYTGTALRQYQFSATTMNECFLVFHVPHDYVPGTDIYFHIHWSNAAAIPNTGNVVWGFEYSWAQGFNQMAFTAPATVKVTQACPATRYQHNIAETTAVTLANLEVDSIILVRVFRDAADVGDTCTDAVFGHTVDVHYQSTNIGTKQKAPAFYV
jgi:hypothetical protein